jgi:hypothetical protein
MYVMSYLGLCDSYSSSSSARTAKASASCDPGGSIGEFIQLTANGKVAMITFVRVYIEDIHTSDLLLCQLLLYIVCKLLCKLLCELLCRAA